MGERRALRLGETLRWPAAACGGEHPGEDTGHTGLEGEWAVGEREGERE